MRKTIRKEKVGYSMGWGNKAHIHYRTKAEAKRGLKQVQRGVKRLQKRK